jgi:hypothetical protein
MNCQRPAIAVPVSAENSAIKKLEILADFIKNNITAAAIVGH